MDVDVIVDVVVDSILLEQLSEREAGKALLVQIVSMLTKMCK